MRSLHTNSAVLAVSVLAMMGAAQAASVEPVFVDGNPTCGDLDPGSVEVKFDPPNDGTKDIVGGTVTIDVSGNGRYFDWEATVGIDTVVVKGGPNANVYYYDEALGDEGLHAPINPQNSQPYGLSHVSFCADYNVEVEKTANPSFNRAFTWNIQKDGDVEYVLLSPGQQYQINYMLTLDQVSIDANWGVSGVISVSNPAPFSATITGVTDAIEGVGNIGVNCPVSFPYVLPAGGNFECSYSSSLPNGANRVNTATATTTGVVEGDSGTALIDFSGATVSTTDDCVDVSDSLVGALGTVCVEDTPKTFTYSWLVGPYPNECRVHVIDNTGSFVSNDTGAMGESSWSVDVEVACDQGGGCTLTPGYWKTHSSYGPAPEDDNWLNLLLDGPDNLFYLSNQTYYEVLWTAPRGNAYYILARAYIAAVLNELNGADTNSVATELSDAESLFATHTPAYIGNLRGRRPPRDEFLELADVLDEFNNGNVGPPHCSEDRTSASE